MSVRNASPSQAPAQEQGVHLRVVPNARRSEVVGMHGDSVKVKVASPALEGKANDAVCELVSEKVGAPLGAVRIVSGLKARDKVIRVEGFTAEEIRGKLLA